MNKATQYLLATYGLTPDDLGVSPKALTVAEVDRLAEKHGLIKKQDFTLAQALDVIATVKPSQKRLATTKDKGKVCATCGNVIYVIRRQVHCFCATPMVWISVFDKDYKG